MLFARFPIQKKLLRVIFLINGIILLVTGVAFFLYELYTFRETTIEKLSTIGKIISANSTAALAFDNPDDAKEILEALKTEPHIVAACLYDRNGKLFSKYSSGEDKQLAPAKPGGEGFHFADGNLEGYESIKEQARLLGTIYLKADMGAMFERLRLYAVVFCLVFALSFLLAFVLVKILTRSISTPIMALAQTAKVISHRKDYSVRAVKISHDELGSLTDAFNQMLDQIQQQDGSLKEFNQNLEQKVRDRTEQLENVNKDLEGFSYSVSHDLRAPLRAIVGFSSILDEEYGGIIDEEGRRIISVIKNNTVKMGRLIDDLLAFSRVTRQDSPRSTIDMQSMVQEAKDSIVTKDTANISWTIGALPSATANGNLIRQVWVNLIGNAVKYSGKKENPHIEIGAFPKDGQTVFFVRDNGVGFDQQYSDKLFKVFQRLHSASEFEGTGIGLALVGKIVEREGGSVWAESELGKGACFYFSLPNDRT